MKKSYKVLSCVLVSSLVLSNTVPIMAAENGDATIVSSATQTASIQVDNSGITINGIYYTPKEFEKLLDTAVPIKASNSGVQTYSIAIAGAAAGSYFIPGVGEVLIAATGAVIVGGVAISAGSWAYKKIVSYFKEHTKNKRKSTHNKHTKPRPGRNTEKKKNHKKGWKSRK